ncbi:MAG: hypothetical protein K6F71_07545 [Ruminococcus sp.]|uniref:hypothetical protein n=1 Tax=Ruminococcus sp. TaxID=41978 RepID=UPI0025D5BDE9|nr:hypothetical protein [Ruminococcus sp.]MCR5540655.1 hypothetical protein [Ruminococcus sp.]
MIVDVRHAENIYIVCGYSDMRKAIDGLAAIDRAEECDKACKNRHDMLNIQHKNAHHC